MRETKTFEVLVHAVNRSDFPISEVVSGGALGELWAESARDSYVRGDLGEHV